jgi:hypothetical protein
MFHADAKPGPQRKLHLVASGRGTEGIRQGEIKMEAYKFAAYPSNSSVASGVTMLVSVWFLVAAGAILTDPPSPYTSQRVHAAAAPVTRFVEAPAPVAAAVAIAPEARLTIVVEARRAVEAHRSVNL